MPPEREDDLARFPPYRLDQAAPLLMSQLHRGQGRVWASHLLWGSFVGLLGAIAVAALGWGLWQGGWVAQIRPTHPPHPMDPTSLALWIALGVGVAIVAGAVGGWIEGVQHECFTESRVAAWLDRRVATDGLFLATVEVWADSGPTRQLSPIGAALAIASDARLRATRGRHLSRQARLPVPFPRTVRAALAIASLTVVAAYGLALYPPRHSATSSDAGPTVSPSTSPQVQAAFDALWEQANRLEQLTDSPAAQAAADQLRAAAEILAAQGEAGFPAALQRLYRAYNDALTSAYAPQPSGQGSADEKSADKAEEAWLSQLAGVTQQVLALAKPDGPAGLSLPTQAVPLPPTPTSLTPDGGSTTNRDEPAPNAPGAGSAPAPRSPAGERTDSLQALQSPSPRPGEPGEASAGTGVSSTPRSPGWTGSVPASPPDSAGEPGAGDAPGQPRGIPGQLGQAGHGDDPNRMGETGAGAGLPPAIGPLDWLPGQPQSGPWWASASPALPQSLPAGSTQRGVVSGSPQAINAEELPAAYRQWVARYFSTPASKE